MTVVTTLARAEANVITSDDCSPPLPGGWLNWIRPFFLIPESFILNHRSLDGYLFLRFLKVLAIICSVGCCIAWPILLPIHGTGGRELQQLDLLTIGNVSTSLKFYAHVLVGWTFFG
jgi:calcium permeable stress-gated cation channel